MEHEHTAEICWLKNKSTEHFHSVWAFIHIREVQADPFCRVRLAAVGLNQTHWCRGSLAPRGCSLRHAVATAGARGVPGGSRSPEPRWAPADHWGVHRWAAVTRARPCLCRASVHGARRCTLRTPDPAFLQTPQNAQGLLPAPALPVFRYLSPADATVTLPWGGDFTVSPTKPPHCNQAPPKGQGKSSSFQTFSTCFHTRFLFPSKSCISLHTANCCICQPVKGVRIFIEIKKSCQLQ